MKKDFCVLKGSAEVTSRLWLWGWKLRDRIWSRALLAPEVLSLVALGSLEPL